MFEVVKPAPQGTVHISDNDLKTVSVRTPGFASDRFPEFVDTLLSGHPSAFAEEISQELEAFAVRVGDVRLIRVEFQVGLHRPRPNPGQCILRLFATAAQYDEVISVPHHFNSRFFHQMVQWIEVDVTQQRGDHASYNVAKLSLIPETVIPRARLRARYGQGWLGREASSRAGHTASELTGGLGHGGHQAQVESGSKG